jgi:hypothetical protein
MQKIDPVNAMLAILIAFYIAKKVSMYIKYKKSGKIVLQVKLKKDILGKAIWVVIAGIWALPVVRLYLSGSVVPPERIKSAIFWVCFICIAGYIETQTPKITEGGITASGNFWRFKDINFCKWSPGETMVLSIEVRKSLLLLKYPATLRWRVLPEQKADISRLMKGKIK